MNKKKTFLVTVTAQVFCTTEIEVEADDEEMASEEALKIAELEGRAFDWDPDLSCLEDILVEDVEEL